MTKYLKFLLIVCVLSIQGVSFAQEVQQVNIENGGYFNVQDHVVSWHAKVYSVEAPFPGSDSYRSYLHQLKQLRFEDRYLAPAKTNTHKSGKAINAADLIYDIGFDGNAYGGIPNDNDIAISRLGQIVSVSNSDMYVYDEVGLELASVSLQDFADELNLVQNSYDPKILYDPNEERFILTFLNGNDASATAIVICFSESIDPTQGWNVYQLDGNPFNNQAWSDFPMVAITDQDYFVTVNHIHSDSASWQTGFMESVIWQIQKEEGYNGATLESVLHSNIEFGAKPIRNLRPAKGGFNLKSEEMYFLSNRNFDYANDTFFVVKIDESLSSNSSPVPTVTAVTSNHEYGLPPDVRQSAFTFLQTNDARPLGAIIQDGKIHFVGNTVDTTTNFCGIYHGVLNVLDANWHIDLDIIGDSDLEYGYPNISFSGQTPYDAQYVISFNHASVDSLPGMSALFYSENDGYSDRLHIKTGTSIVNVVNGNYERWGDYSGSQRLYHDPGVVWINGFIGFRDDTQTFNKFRHRTYIAKVSSPDKTHTGINPVSIQNDVLFPNPTYEQFSVRFEVQDKVTANFALYNLQGQLVKYLMKRNLKAGENEMLFSTEALAAGTYLLHVYTDEYVDILKTQVVKK